MICTIFSFFYKHRNLYIIINKKIEIMLKSEIIYREILESKDKKLTQFALAKKLGFSLSTVNNALKPIASMGAVKIFRTGLKITDREKIILYWASVRNIEKDTIYKTRSSLLPSQIEKSMPAGVIYTAYSAFKFRFKHVPADYSEVYVYHWDLDEIKKRFPESKGPPNVFILKPDKHLIEISKNNTAPLSQIFVDLWNIKEWYAKEFVMALKEEVL